MTEISPDQSSPASDYLADNDIAGVLRWLRATPQLEFAEVAYWLGEAADRMGFAELSHVCAHVRATPDDPELLFQLGYECIEHGVPFLAERPLQWALDRKPHVAIVDELVAALEEQSRHAEAVAVLDAHPELLRPWPEHYLLAYNALMSGNPSRARDVAAALPRAEGDWRSLEQRLTQLLERARLAEAASGLDVTDLRGWQFVSGGSILATLSPYGFSSGMTGRWGFLSDSFPLCHRSLLRLKVVLNAAGITPRRVSWLPDRDSEVLGLAAAQLLGLPAAPYDPESDHPESDHPGSYDPETEALVVAYDLTQITPELVETLVERRPGQLLWEHASNWVTPPLVSADVVGLVHQGITTPWGSRMSVGEHGITELPPRGEPAAELAQLILQSAPEDDPGDGETPEDSDTTLAQFSLAVLPTWRTGNRSAVRGTGPVSSVVFG